MRAFAQRTRIPSVATLKGLGGLPTDAPGFLGMLGMHGSRAANTAIDECDLLICVGARFDDRATGKIDTLRAARPQSSISTAIPPRSAS